MSRSSFPVFKLDELFIKQLRKPYLAGIIFWIVSYVTVRLIDVEFKLETKPVRVAIARREEKRNATVLVVDSYLLQPFTLRIIRLENVALT